MGKLVVPMAGTGSGQQVFVTPESAGWDHVGFEVHRLPAGQILRGREETRESCMVLFSGVANVQTTDEQWNGIGSRMSVFDATPATAVYVSAGDEYSLTAVTDVELAICTAPGHIRREARLITPDSIQTEHRGQGILARRVQNILSEEDTADGLLVVEVRVDGGRWSGFPPHKHDQLDLPDESMLEETYHFRMNPSNGAAWMKVYTGDGSLDEMMTIRNGDTVLVPRGYHPVCALPGYDCYFINVMAGPVRTWKFRTDPQHTGVLDWKS